MTTKDFAAAIQNKISEIHNQTEIQLGKLNEEAAIKYNHIESKFDCDLSYYENIAVYAWAERGKRIAMLEMQEFLNKLQKQL